MGEQRNNSTFEFLPVSINALIAIPAAVCPHLSAAICVCVCAHAVLCGEVACQCFSFMLLVRCVSYGVATAPSCAPCVRPSGYLEELLGEEIQVQEVGHPQSLHKHMHEHAHTHTHTHARTHTASLYCQYASHLTGVG